MESLEMEKDKEGTDSTKGSKADGPPTKRSKTSQKDSAMHFLLGTLSERESISTCSDELDHFLKIQKDFPLCQSSKTAVVHPCYVCAF